MSETLCWHCKNACGDCSWSRQKHTPVKGWTAVRRDVPVNGRPEESYCVIKCPEFMPDRGYIPPAPDTKKTDVSVDYKGLWKLCDEKFGSHTRAFGEAGVSWTTLAKMHSGGLVNLDIFVKLASVLHCKLEDMVVLV